MSTSMSAADATVAKSSINPKNLSKPPQERGSFPLGVVSEFQRDPMGLYIRLVREYRDIVRIRFGPYIAYQIHHPDFIKHILVDNNRNYKRNVLGNRLLKIITGENIITSDGKFWRKQRRLMQPAFHRRHIHGFGQIMTSAGETMLSQWRDMLPGQIVDIDQEMMRVTLTIVGQALFSVDLSDETNDFGRTMTASSEYFAYRMSHPFAPPLWVPTRRNRKFKKAAAAAAYLVPEMIATRRQLIASQGSAHETGRQCDLMDLLLEARYEDSGEGMSDAQLGTEISTMLGAGHETTANSLSWTLYLLSKHPEIEAKLHHEVDSVLAGRIPTVEDLGDLPYSRMVLEESMRLYPAAWAMSRQSINADQLGDYALPANSGLIIPIYAIHRHPDFWDEPERFDPERFTPERAEQQHRFAYFPFGAGPRKCIGQIFAMMEAQLLLAMITQQFRLRTVPGYQAKPQPLVALRLGGGLPMTLEMRGA